MNSGYKDPTFDRAAGMEKRERAALKIKYGWFADHTKQTVAVKPMAVYVNHLGELEVVPVNLTTKGIRKGATQTRYSALEAASQKRICTKLGEYHGNSLSTPRSEWLNVTDLILEDIEAYIVETGEWPDISKAVA